MSPVAPPVALPNEAVIVINGDTLTQAEALTLRVALSMFSMEMQVEGLGSDPTGKIIREGYIASSYSILRKMHKYRGA